MTGALQSTAFRGRRSLAVGIAVAAFAVACMKLKREEDYRRYYRAPALVDLHRALRDQRVDGRIVLDLQQEPDFEVVWTTVVGIELEARRHGEDLLCIADNWHIVFTKQARCSAEEIAKGRHLIVMKSPRDPPPDRRPVVEGMGLSFYEAAARGD